MTPEQKRIKIAECCPAIFKVIDGKVYWRDDGGLVDILQDLNAMAQAEAIIRDAPETPEGDIQRKQWRRELKKITGWTYSEFATAAQRADAFLKVKGIL